MDKTNRTTHMRGSAQNAKSAKAWHSQSAIELGVAGAKSYSPPPPRRHGRPCTRQLSVPLILAKTFAKTRQESRRLHSLAQEFWVNVKGAHSPRHSFIKNELSFEHLIHL
jgi:hypothetical protein